MMTNIFSANFSGAQVDRCESGISESIGFKMVKFHDSKEVFTVISSDEGTDDFYFDDFVFLNE